MNDSVFRIATREAIREILTENAQHGRFGLVLSDDDLQRAADKIVDLMETALTLRSGVQDRLGIALGEAPAPHTPTLSRRAPTRPAPEPADEFGGRTPSFPRTRNAADIYEKPSPTPRQGALDSTPVAPAYDVRLTRRQRVALSDNEKERLGGGPR